MLKTKAKTAIFLGLLILLALVFPHQNTYADSGNDNEILLTFGGDVTFGDYKGTQQEFFEKNGNDYSIIFSNLYDIFSNDDLTMVNLETTITDASNHKDKDYAFRAPFEYVNILTEGSVEAVSIANNHGKDFYEEGRYDTARTLMENNIIVAGENYVGSVEIKGIQIALLGYTTFETGGFDYIAAIERDISYMNRTHDIVIVMMHWGNELVYTTKKSDIDLGHKLIDLGADLVVGSHPHNIKGIEYYKGKYIVYSLGNCSFAGSGSPTDDDIILFQQKFEKTDSGVVPGDAKIIPCSVSSPENVGGYSNDFIPTPYEGEDIAKVLNKVQEFSSQMDYGLKEISADWIEDPYTWEEYKLDKLAEKDNGG